MVRAAVVVLAGGSGSRAGAGADGTPLNKVYRRLGGREILLWSLQTAARLPEVIRLVLVIRAQDAELTARMLADHPLRPPVDVVTGGSTRHASEDAALARLKPAIAAGELDVVVIHDGARPLATAPLYAAVIAEAARHGGALPAFPAGPLLATDREPNGPGPETTGGADRSLVRVQTPQAFRAAPLLDAYAAAARDGFEGTDTASTVEHYGALPVHIVAGSPTNLKVTYPVDVAIAEELLARRASA